MASDGHQALASSIKNVHQTLRLEARKVGEEKAWFDHCQRGEVLQTYAQAMKQLATEHWDRNADDDQNKKAVSRISWIVKQCEDYYYSDGMNESFSKELALCLRFKLDTNEILDHKPDKHILRPKLRVLDVGSCYNPFKKFPRFDVVAVDIAPASEDVLHCDFLNLEVTDQRSAKLHSNERIHQLCAASFNVVIFSLLLEYLPSSKQRYVCCSKASQLLAPGGILCIVTPDSKHATANSGIMKKWKYALANVGLLRIQYDKLPHLHCMVFRKCVHSTVSKQWLTSSLASESRKGKFFDAPEQLMAIPQDYHLYQEHEKECVIDDTRDDDETVASIFADLPAL
ncbi:S-adenosylmethionine sensor upstream of mTORC1 [Thrips palmi]|uniref:S-adenosylmethionine sensor upstream of mTORC1 n=1 Tax=Thrips palmi TaxID=161013 RepID=A0A6P8ZHT4_THRPL|nr:S-adenosylmethionine sensor upstream of mTORC1 [Thrips palmi]